MKLSEWADSDCSLGAISDSAMCNGLFMFWDSFAGLCSYASNEVTTVSFTDSGNEVAIYVEYLLL